MPLSFNHVAEIAQVVERRPEKPGVPSASLGLGTIFPQNILIQVIYFIEKNGAVPITIKFFRRIGAAHRRQIFSLIPPPHSYHDDL